ncbi:MAG TPA: ATP-grasp domain-containing protein [Candidatus Absconditabacterales bacterium]|nr:ATP-grasp domain-containing protein [Candidatus Absconditabacterales bacterium]
MEFQSFASNEIYKWAKKYNISAKAISYEDSLLELEYKGKKELLKQTATRFTNIIQGRICDNKFLSTKYLSEHGIVNVPKNMVIEKLEQINFSTIKYPVVVKPLKGHGGEGISIGIKNKTELQQAFLGAKKHYFRVLIEEYIEGDDYRFLVIGNNVFVAKRLAAHIIGDGQMTIKALITQENTRRGKTQKLLVPIQIDKETLRIMKHQKYTLHSIPKLGEIVYLRKNANLSTGGTVIDYTDSIHQKNKQLALQIAKIMNMKIIAIDFLFKDPGQKYSDKNGVIIEINDTPGIRVHHPREEEVVKSIFEVLFPNSTSGKYS